MYAGAVLMCGCGNMLLSSISDGDFVKLQGVDFGEKGPAKVRARVRTNGKEGVIRVTAGYPNKDVLAYIPVNGEGTVSCEARIDTTVTGVTDIFFTFSGEGYEVEEWVFTER